MKYNYDEEKKEMHFYYKFEEGVAEKSFGVNVARMV